MKIHRLTGLLIALGTVMVLFSACRKNEVQTVASAPQYYSYYPLQTGATYIYRVDSAVYNAFKGRFDSSVNYLKVIIDFQVMDNTGDLAYKELRYWTADTSLGWSPVRVWTTKRTGKTAETWEENIRYVRLSFPIVLNKSWDGNQFNTTDSLKEYNYHYTEVNTPFIMPVTGQKFDSTVMVQQVVYHDGLQTFNASERYANNIGLIYRQGMDTSFNGLHTVQGSYFYKQTLLKYIR